MNTILIDKTDDGYAVTNIVGINVKWGHERIKGVEDEAQLSEILQGEGVPEESVKEALTTLQNKLSTTVTFPQRQDR